MKRFLLIAVALSLSACSSITPPATASTAPAAEEVSATPLDLRISQLVDVVKGNIKPEDYFDDSFLAAVPAAQFSAILKSMIARYGQPLAVIHVDKKKPEGAALKLEFEKAIATININVSGSALHKVNGLLATGFEAKNDSFDKIDAEFGALPGSAGYVVEKLNDGRPNELVAARDASKQYAIGSTFKLYILAELAAQIEAGERKWSDVVPLAHRSFSSSATSRWPENSPVTLQTLALQMISVSDNSATDTLLRAVGRSNVERKLAQIGHSDPDKMLPFLSTVEAFALKAPANAALQQRYIKASEAQQRDIIAEEQGKLGFAQVDLKTFDNGPVLIDSIEWFASPYDLSNLLNHIRRSGNKRMLEVMAVNRGIGAEAAKKWNYLGYKGGSEPGVMSMSFLAQSKAGQWYAVSGSWNNPAKAVDDVAFVGLMTRLLQAVE